MADLDFAQLLEQFTQKWGGEVLQYACLHLCKPGDAAGLQKAMGEDFLGVFATQTAASIKFQYHHAMPSYGSRSINAAQHWLTLVNGKVAIWRHHNGTDPNPHKNVKPMQFVDSCGTKYVG